jgi:hypothetical protein
MLEQYFGCECQCLNHIAHMGYFPPEKDVEVDEEDNVIYFSVRTEYLYKTIFPSLSLNPLDWKDDLGYYFNWHILKRIPIAIGYIFNPLYVRKNGLLDCFDFQNKNLPEMKKFLSNLTDQEELVSKTHWLTINNDKVEIKFCIERIDKDFPYWLGWEIQFITRWKLFGRVKHALKYIFGKYDNEQAFEINEKDAKRLKGLITVVRKMNEEDERN